MRIENKKGLRLLNLMMTFSISAAFIQKTCQLAKLHSLGTACILPQAKAQLHRQHRVLLILRTLPDAMAHYLDSKNVKLFTEMGVYTDIEMNSHYEIKLEKYAQILNIEVQTMLEMISKDILPAAFKYMDSVSKTAIDLKAVVPGAKASAQSELLSKLDILVNSLAEKAAKLDKLHEAAQNAGDCMKIARAYVKSSLKNTRRF